MKDRRGYFPAYRYPLEQNRWAEWRYEWDGDERIDAARLRLAEHERKGTRVLLREGWQGAARLHTKTVEELAKDKEAARANAAAADKGKMTKEPA